MKNYAIILASGTGSRFGSDKPKQFLKLAGKTILEHTIDIFEKAENIDEIIIVMNPQYRFFFEELLIKNNYHKISKVLNGGDTRKESSYIGISSIQDKEANVLVHDGVRPFLSHRIIHDCLVALEKYKAVDVAISSADTLIQVNNNIIDSIPLREKIQRGQTPQCFKLSLIKKAHELSKDDCNFTDDCGLVVKYNLAEVFVVNGDNKNIKITYQEDLMLAEKLFQLSNKDSLENVDLSRLKEKVLVVFGGNSGIGECIANEAKKHQARVVTLSRSNHCDITNYADVQHHLAQIYAEEGHIDYVINTAGILQMGKLEDRSIDSISQEILANYTGSIHVVKASIPYLSQSNTQRGGGG